MKLFEKLNKGCRQAGQTLAATFRGAHLEDVIAGESRLARKGYSNVEFTGITRTQKGALAAFTVDTAKGRKPAILMADRIEAALAINGGQPPAEIWPAIQRYRVAMMKTDRVLEQAPPGADFRVTQS